MNNYFKQRIDDTRQAYLDALERRQEWAEEEKQILEMENKYQEEMQTREFFDKYYAC